MILLVGLGLLGYGLKRCEWPRAPFVIGLILGPIMDISLHQSLAIWGPAFVLRPIALCLALATIATVVTSLRSHARRKGDRATA
jgi:TctA family transporter